MAHYKFPCNARKNISPSFAAHTCQTSLFIRRNFLWRQTYDYHKPPFAAWETTYTLKIADGLSVTDCSAWNIAAVARHIQCVALDKACLSVKWVHGVYSRRHTTWDVHFTGSSSLYWNWRKILKIRSYFAAGFHATIWIASASGNFYIFSGYIWLKVPKSSILCIQSSGKSLVPKQSFCSWLLCHGRLQTKDSSWRWWFLYNQIYVAYFLIRRITTTCHFNGGSEKLCC